MVDRALVFISLLTVGTAQAVAPDVPAGISLPAPAPRLGPVGLSQDLPDAVQGFLSDVGPGWTVVMDPRTQTAHRIYGPGISLDEAPEDEAAAEAAAWDLLARWPALLGPGVTLDDLKPAIIHRSRGTWYIGLSRLLDGVPIEGAMVELRIRGDRVVLLSFDTFPGLSVDPWPKIDSTAAIQTAEEAIGAAQPEQIGAPRLVVVPMDKDNGLFAHLAWAVELRTRQPADWSIWYVDAHTGLPLARDRRLRTSAVGTMMGQLDLRGLSGTEKGALAHLSVLGQQTAADGSIDLSVALNANVMLEGEYVDVIDYTGADLSQYVSMASDGDEALLTASSEEDRAEIDIFAFVNLARDRVVSMHYANSWARRRVSAYANINDYCNAYYDGGSINFYRAGGGCNNTGRVRDIVFHEYGHGVHDTAITTGYFEGAMGEGAADYLSATLNDDPVIAVGFYSSGAALRRLDGGQVYPRDLAYEVHYDGLIYGGAMWDLRVALIDKLGHGPGVERADALFYATLEGASGMVDAYGDALLAADDDGDITNGVPDGCEIHNAFDAHGLAIGPTAYSSMRIRHAPLGHQPDGGKTPIEVRVVRGLCGGNEVQRVAVSATSEDGRTASFDLELESGNLWTGTVPGRLGPGLIRYAITATDGFASKRMPQNTDRTLAFYSGPLTELYCQNFEAGWRGWTHGASGLDASVVGIDEWEIGPPEGLGGDPIDAPSGDQVAGLDLGGSGDGDGRYEPDLRTWLRSDRIDVSGHDDVRLQWWGWLSVENATYDQAWVNVNGETEWSNADSATGRDHEDRDWIFEDVYLGSPGKVKLGFELESDGGKELGGWAIDRVCLVVPGTEGSGGGTGQGGVGGRGDERSPFCSEWSDCEGPALLEGKAGCGCSGVPRGAPWWLGLLPLALLRRRRARI